MPECTSALPLLEGNKKNKKKKERSATAQANVGSIGGSCAHRKFGVWVAAEQDAATPV